MRSEENILKKQLLNGSVSQFDIQQTHTNIQPPRRQKVNFSYLSLIFGIQVLDLDAASRAKGVDVMGRQAGGNAGAGR